MLLSIAPSAHASADILVLPIFSEAFAKASDKALLPLPAALRKSLQPLLLQEKFSGKAEQSFLLHMPQGLSQPRLLLLGLGEAKLFKNHKLRSLLGSLVKTAHKLNAHKLSILWPEAFCSADMVQAATEGAVLSSYSFDKWKTQKEPSPLKSIQLVCKLNATLMRQLQGAIRLGTCIAQAQNWARALTDEPAHSLTPVALAKAAKAMALKHGLKVRVFGRSGLERLRMGMFLAVAQGSALEPQLIELRYEPKSPAHKKRKPLYWVGKAVTFDSGGLSLKSHGSMQGMHGDMAGAAAVMGAMQVVALLRPPFPVVALLGACENMPSHKAYRPTDILTSRMGKTVEVCNTDAEGRLVLGDLLCMATENNPQAIVNLATLTGACMVALGQFIAGLFGNDETLVAQIERAAKQAGEKIWRLPLCEQQKEGLKSDVADLKNMADSYYGGAINGALFLREFIKEIPWAHLDICGPSQSSQASGWMHKGATGFGVRSLVALIATLQETPKT
ncbi:MAG: leucyl aminopeptidase [Cystobacterineae bacterium]|nr:leucyl aminopeptidase [Cystobacterineae bacterium]